MAMVNTRRTIIYLETSARQWFSRLAPLLVGFLLSACSSGLHRKVETLSQKELRLRASVAALVTQHHQMRSQLKSAQDQHSELQSRISQAEAYAVYSQCLASRAHFDATRQRMYAEQMRIATEYSACASGFAKSQREFSALGCLLSLAVLRGLGGVAACGGVLAASESITTKCGQRPQPRSPEEIENAVRNELGLSTMPVCGNPDMQRSR